MSGMDKEKAEAAAEAKIARFFREDGLPDHDAAFMVLLAQREAVRRLRLSLLALGAVSLVAGIVLWALSPWLVELFARFAGHMELLGSAAVVLIVVASVLVMVGLPFGPPMRRGEEAR